jgi:hypothetical protein
MLEHVVVKPKSRIYFSMQGTTRPATRTHTTSPPLAMPPDLDEACKTSSGMLEHTAVNPQNEIIFCIQRIRKDSFYSVIVPTIGTMIVPTTCPIVTQDK